MENKANESAVNLCTIVRAMFAKDAQGLTQPGQERINIEESFQIIPHFQMISSKVKERAKFEVRGSLSSNPSKRIPLNHCQLNDLTDRSSIDSLLGKEDRGDWV